MTRHIRLPLAANTTATHCGSCKAIALKDPHRENGGMFELEMCTRFDKTFGLDKPYPRSFECRKAEKTPWLPMSSAPKDGTVVLLVARHNGENFVTTGLYLSGAWRVVRRNVDPEPLAWMPLPELPEVLP